MVALTIRDKFLFFAFLLYLLYGKEWFFVLIILIEKLDELFKEIRQSWKELPKVLTRAAMAKCLSRLPITFKTSDEAQAYIRNSLECCTDEIEKEACVRMLRSIME